jgi:FKBP-type peptidyl-prolyl cis-trans isomerase SlyD
MILNTSPRVFAFNYTLRSSTGEILDASEANQPLPFLEGSGQIIPALEKQVLLMQEGDKKKISLTSDEAYGPQKDNLIMEVDIAELAHISDLKVGSYLQLDLGDQTKVVRVTQLNNGKVTLDANHPLAGQPLEFEIELVLVRAATANEVAHGHAHGIHGTHNH